MVSLRKSYNSDHYCGGVLISGNRDQIILILHHVFERKSRDRTVITEAPIRVRKYTGCTLKLRAVKLLFVVFGRLSYTFLSDKICNLSVQPVFQTFPNLSRSEIFNLILARRRICFDGSALYLSW